MGSPKGLAYDLGSPDMGGPKGLAYDLGSPKGLAYELAYERAWTANE
jgi:hypothetical protein